MAIGPTSRRARGARKRARSATRRSFRVNRRERDIRKLAGGYVQSQRGAGAGKWASVDAA